MVAKTLGSRSCGDGMIGYIVGEDYWTALNLLERVQSM
jgi:hypothetical protein